MHIILGAPKKERIKPLIQSKGLIIGVDRGAWIAVEEEIKLDIALGDFDSITDHEKVKIKQYSKEVLSSPSDKDDTDAELALFYVVTNLVADNIYLYNWQGGRADHLYSLFMLILQERFLPLVSKIKFVSEDNYISYYRAGQYTLSKVESMQYLSFILLTKIEELTLKDVKYPVVKANYNSPRALISNEFLKEEAFFSFEKGIIAVIQSRDAN